MKFLQKMNFNLLVAKVKAEQKVKEFLYDENGDTNFISIMVLLGIALGLAGIFLTFQEDIMNWVDTNIGTFFDKNVTQSSRTGS